MLALGELPNKDKDAIMPLFRLSPWGVSHHLDSSVERIRKAFGTRPAYLELGDAGYVDPEKRRPVHGELDELRDAQNGYQKWYEFLNREEHEYFIPGLQTGGSLADFYQQIELLYSLGRGVLIRFKSPSEGAVSAAARAISERTGGGVSVTFVLDFEKQDSGFENLEEEIKTLIKIIYDNCSSAKIAVSASSFPGSFTSISDQEIYERVVFNNLVDDVSSELIYSDRGSARAEKQLGGGGLPAPRVDYAKKTKWYFFRQSSPLASTFKGYQAQALAVTRDPKVWDKGLKLWACQMIERTAAGDDQGGISSPNRSTAVRINLHLHRQIFYYDDVGFLDTDEEWTD